MLPAHRALMGILSECHRPRNNAGAAEHVIVITKSAVIGDKKTAENSTATDSALLSTSMKFNFSHKA